MRSLRTATKKRKSFKKKRKNIKIWSLSLLFLQVTKKELNYVFFTFLFPNYIMPTTPKYIKPKSPSINICWLIRIYHVSGLHTPVLSGNFHFCFWNIRKDFAERTLDEETVKKTCKVEVDWRLSHSALLTFQKNTVTKTQKDFFKSLVENVTMYMKCNNKVI